MSVRFLRCLSAVSLLCVFLFVSSPARADSYTFRLVASDNTGSFINADDAGDYTLRLSSTYTDRYCGPQTSQCYATYSAYTGTTTYTAFMPALPDNPQPVAGAGCSIDTALFETVFSQACNNGYEFVSGLLKNGPIGIYTGSGSIVDLLYTGSMDGHVVVTPSGSIFFTDGLNDSLVAGMNNTNAVTAQPISFATPEPNSLVLLGTGAVALIGAVRRKFLD